MATKAKVCSKKATGNGAFVESCDQIPKEVDLGGFLWACFSSYHLHTLISDSKLDMTDYKGSDLVFSNSFT